MNILTRRDSKWHEGAFRPCKLWFLGISGNADRFNSLDAILDCLKQMESNLMGMRQLRQYIDSNLGTEMLDLLIEEAELKIAEVKRKVMQ